MCDIQLLTGTTAGKYIRNGLQNNLTWPRPLARRCGSCFEDANCIDGTLPSKKSHGRILGTAHESKMATFSNVMPAMIVKRLGDVR